MPRPGLQRFLLAALALAALGYVLAGPLVRGIGRHLVLTDTPEPADAIVVLNTGIDLFPRLTEAAGLFRRGYAPRIVLDGNRKSETLRRLEAMGFQECCPWYEESLRILALLGVPREAVLTIDAEDAYDTVSEAEAVGPELLRRGLQKILLTTSRYHSHRAFSIWKGLYGDRMTILSTPAAEDPYDPEGWWKDGRQIRWVLSEYGAWVYAWIKSR